MLFTACDLPFSANVENVKSGELADYEGTNVPSSKEETTAALSEGAGYAVMMVTDGLANNSAINGTLNRHHRYCRWYVIKGVGNYPFNSRPKHNSLESKSPLYIALCFFLNNVL